MLACKLRLIKQNLMNKFVFLNDIIKRVVNHFCNNYMHAINFQGCTANLYHRVTCDL